MKIFVKAKPYAKEERVEQTGEMHFIVAVKEPPVEGRANQAIEKAIAKHFDVPLSQVRIVSGQASRQKTIEIDIL